MYAAQSYIRVRINVFGPGWNRLCHVDSRSTVVGGLLIGLSVLLFLFDVKFERGHVGSGGLRFGAMFYKPENRRFRSLAVTCVAFVGLSLPVIGMHYLSSRPPVARKDGAANIPAERIATQPLSNVVPPKTPEIMRYIKVQLTLDSNTHAGYDFHVSVANQNDVPITLEAIDYAVFPNGAQGRQKLTFKNVFPGQPVSIPSLPFQGLKAQGHLSYNIQYSVTVDGKSVTYLALYTFLLPRVPQLSLPIDPFQAELQIGVLPVQTEKDTYADFAKPQGTLLVEEPEHRQDGHFVFEDIRGETRRLVIDAENSGVWFSSVFPDGKVKSAHLTFARQPLHAFGLNWNDAKDTLSLGVDSGIQVAGVAVDSTSPRAASHPTLRQQPRPGRK